MESLGILEWPGRDETTVALDGPFRFEFNHPLVGPIWQGGVSVIGPGGKPVEGLNARATGRFLSLTPSLPLEQGLNDASFVPGMVYRIELAGIPKLAALRSTGGIALHGAHSFSFKTADLHDPLLFSGTGVVPGPIRLQLPNGLEKPIASDPDGKWRIPLSGPLDPRTLSDPARLQLPDREDPLLVYLTLEQNDFNGSVLLVDRGPEGGWAILELPSTLRGTHGIGLVEGERRVRLRWSTGGRKGLLTPQ